MKIGLSIAGVILLLLIVFLGYMGAFNTVEVREEVQGPFYVISHHQTGEYRKVGETFRTLMKELPASGLKGYRIFGIYLDNPRKVPKDQLRSEVGVLFSEPLKTKPQGISLALEERTIPVRKYLVVDFPFKNFFSVFLGIYKIYPKLFEACEKRGCDLESRYIMEIYEPVAGKNAKYLLPID
ncbi:GyrI-like small molecule binding domain protein [Leptospira broomii serovar Hurstbridge str. 5399]|uniref:GyrI-like small molecule binding domain protein n=1 Tax=Leptospira broomii serovar Hurstbridge str. 5399 TaxID=1049789 RepID=T0F7W1_9LEPT|nr:GyrI-like domain-containing protein [Leptospira broomii]EQA43991.1 GyrI-like small molecule binding domain protein [Leptospira broomii serovar Hurstbridge str. 5399]